MSNAMREWMDLATAKEKAMLARLAKTSVGQLRQLAGGYRTKSMPRTKAELALRLERASIAMNERNDALPILFRERFSAACASCDFLKACRK